MFLGQEPSLLYLMPFSSYMYMNIWTILGTTKVIFLPLMIAIVYCWATSRAQGLDEGSPAVLSLKLVEKSAWWYLFVIMLFIVPTRPVPVVVNSYVCGVDHREAVYSGSFPQSGAVTGEVRFPLMLGLINNLSVSAFETLKGGLYCGVDTKLASDASSTAYVVKDAAIRRQARLLNDQCYVKAVQRYQEGQRTGSLRQNFIGADPRDNFFFGLNSMQLYEGSARLDGNQGSLIATFPLKYWTGNQSPSSYGPLLKIETSTFSADEATVSCSGFATHLYHELGQVIDTDYAAELDTLYETKRQYPDSNGVVYTRDRVRDEMIHDSFVGVTLGYSDNLIIQSDTTYRMQQMVDAAKNLDNTKNSTTVQLDSRTVELLTAPPGIDDVSGIVHQGATWLGQFVNWFTGLFKSQAMFAYAATLFASFTALSFMIFPIYLVIAGYTVRSVLNVVLIIVYLTGLYYMLEIAYVVTNTLSAASDSIGGVEPGSFYSGAVDHLSTMTVIVVTVLWTAVLGAMGMTLGPMVDSILSGQIASSGVTGMKVLGKAAKMAVTKGKG